MINFKKLSLERRIAEFLQRTLTRLEELWRQFDEGDASINRLNPPANLAYLNTNYHGQVRAIYEDYMARITERFEATQPPAAESEPTTANDLQGPSKVGDNKYLLQQRILLNSEHRSLPLIDPSPQEFCKIKMLMLQCYGTQLEEKFWPPPLTNNLPFTPPILTIARNNE